MFTKTLLTVGLMMSSPFRPLPEDAPKDAPESKNETQADGRISGLPHSFGRSFATLDAYLAHLREHAAPVDLPWWRELRDDRYERVTSFVGKKRAPVIATRDELERKYGFKK